MGKAGRSYATGKDAIQPGMRGVLVTCFRNVESKCTNELYQLLNRVLESSTDEQSEAEETTVSFEEQIKAEIVGLKDRSSKPFMAMDTKGLQCIVFVKTAESVEPTSVISDLFKKIREREIKSVRYALVSQEFIFISFRFCQRIMPIQIICSAKIEEIRKEATKLIGNSLKGQGFDYCVVFESRLNDSLDRMTVIDMIAEIVGPSHRVNLGTPKKVILVQVFKSYCGLSVLDSWAENRKYNVQEVLKQAIELENRSGE